MPDDHHLKSKIIAEIRSVYPDLSETFYGSELIRRVTHKIIASENRYPYPDTVLRYFRQLREKELSCECTNRQRSIYLKNQAK